MANEKADYNFAACELIAELREKSGKTQTDIATALGVTQSTISKIERGDLKLDLMELRNLCDAVGVPLHDFVGVLESRFSATG